MELTRISDCDARARQHDDAATHRPRLSAVILLVVAGIEQVLVGFEGEPQRGGVGDEQDHRDADRECLQVSRKLYGARGGFGQAAA
jgi:hypothetical protein